jgi:hypothetical protein
MTTNEDTLDPVTEAEESYPPKPQPARKRATKAEATKAKIAQIQAAKPEPQASGIQRQLGQQVTIHSDLYKLGLSRFKRNVSWTDVPQIEELDHNHLFHTFNSDGKQQFYCTAVGGHFHLMEVFPGKDGEAPRVKCASGPLKWVQRKVRGRFTKVAEPVLLPEGEDEDNHVHETFYLGSTEVTKRMGNTVAAGIIAADAQKTAPIAGVRG